MRVSCITMETPVELIALGLMNILIYAISSNDAQMSSIDFSKQATASARDTIHDVTD